jgi:hypothetical protein
MLGEHRRIGEALVEHVVVHVLMTRAFSIAEWYGCGAG